MRIIDRVAAALHAVTPSIILSANAPHAESWLPGVRVIRDNASERGSLIGIHSALAATHDDVLIVAWDMPFVDPALMKLIVERSEGATAVVPMGPRGPEPMCAWYARETRSLAADALQRGEYRLGALLERLPRLVTIPLAVVAKYGDPARLFFNVNTADDLAAAERMARGE